MPARKPQDARRGQLVNGLLWAGVALSPLAVLVLLFGSSTAALRVAVTLTTLTVVMVAVSIALRPSVELLRVDIEERVLDEVDTIRARAREDVSTAARNTHRALSERIRVLGETIEGLRDQIDEMQAATFIGDQNQPGPGGHAAHPGGPGMVRRTETVHVTRRTTLVGGEDDGQGTVYGSRPAGAVEGEWRERGPELQVEDRWAALRRDDDHRRGDERRRDDGYGEADWDATFRSLSAKPTPALPPARGDSYDRHDVRHDVRHEDRRDDRDDRDRIRPGGRDHERDYDPSPDRGSDRGYDRESDRGYERERDRGSDRERDRDRERHYDRGSDRGWDRGLDRERGYDREHDRGYGRDRDDDRGGDYDRGRDDRPYPPRQRGPHRSEYDR